MHSREKNKKSFMPNKKNLLFYSEVKNEKNIFNVLFIVFVEKGNEKKI
jgi:hypothetical protein